MRLSRDLRAAAVCAAVVFGCVVASLIFTSEAGELAAIWPANSAMLALVIRHPRRLTPMLLAVAWTANVAANLTVGLGLGRTLTLATANVAEVGVALELLRRAGGPKVDLSRLRHLTALGLAAAIAPVVGGTIAAGGIYVLERVPVFETLAQWWLACALALVVLAPAFLVLSARRLTRLWRPEVRVGTLALAVLLVAALGLAFGQARYPLGFLIAPVLMLTAYQRGLTGAVVALLVTAVAASAATVFGLGPFAGLATLVQREVAVQGFLAIMVAGTLPLAAAMARRRRLERSLQSARAAAERNERRYRMLAEHVTDVILRVDVSGRVLFVSPSSTTVIGLAPEQMVGRSIPDMIHPEDEVRVAREIRRLLDDPEAQPEAVEFRIRHADGRWVWLEAKPTPVRGADGEVREFVDLLRDVNARKAAEAELAEARRQAEAAAAAKSDFLATMSHELRTPLTSIIGFSGLLAESDRLGPDESRHVERIRVASDALLSVINDVLDYSKLEAGGVELEPRAFCLDALVAESVGLVAQQAQTKGLALTTAFEPQARRVALVGDAPRLRQVLLNFLSNAVKFTGRGGVTVKVDVAALDEERTRLTVAVTDTGIGVAPDKLDRLFERFVQAEGSISRRFGGTGLGLSISRRLIDMMGGEVGVDSRLGEGSTFWFSVPLPRATAAAEALEAGAAPLGVGRVLMVDDNEANRELVGAVLGALGLEVDTAEDGAQAVEAVLAGAYDLVLMDVHMPVMNGLEATRTIRQLGPRFATLPIVALTADVRPEHVARCREAGMDDHVGKPIVPARLYATLSRWMQDEAA